MIPQRRLLSELPRISHVLYTKDGTPIAQNTISLGIRGKIRFVSNRGRVINQHNNLTYTGRRFVLEAINSLVPNQSLQLTLNQILDINANVTTNDPLDLKKRAICLYGVGNGGATMTFGQIKSSTINDNNLFNIIPFRIVPINSDLSPTERQTYFMRKEISVDGIAYYAYYLKKTTSEGISAKLANLNYSPTVEDNSPTKEANAQLSLNNIDVFTNYQIKIDPSDVIDYYSIVAKNRSEARYNELSLFFGIPAQFTDGSGNEYIDYIAVESFSHLTFNNVGLDKDISDHGYRYCISI